jgi:hypothetical protein
MVEARHEGLDQLLVAATAIQNLERVSWICKQAVEGEAVKDFRGRECVSSLEEPSNSPFKTVLGCVSFCKIRRTEDSCEQLE